MTYIIYNKIGKILRVIDCPKVMSKIQAKKDEFIMKGIANDVTQKIVDGKIVNKTSEEMMRDNPPISEIFESWKPAYITKEQWQDVLGRLDNLEKS